MGADIMTVEAARLSPEGRVSIPAAVRHQLGVGAGDRIIFVQQDDGTYLMTTPMTLVREMWANNHGGDAGDAGEYVRDMREADNEQERLRAEDEAAQPQTRTSEEVHAGLKAALGL